jgi:hypothetical protein
MEGLNDTRAFQPEKSQMAAALHERSLERSVCVAANMAAGERRA